MAAGRKTGLVVPEGGEPLPERLAAAIEALIRDGSYRAGDRLPTHRALAAEAGVAIGTVTRAIDLLHRRGLLRGEVGRGTFVHVPREGAGGVIDLTINGPPPIIRPEDFAAAAARAAQRAALLPASGYGDLRGTAEQRAVIADWLSRTRLTARAEEVLLCVGAQQAMHLAFAELRGLSPGIATEVSTFPGAIAAAADLGLRMLPVPHDAEGLLPEALERVLAAGEARIVYVTPVCQNPLGFETGEARRRALLEVCLRHGAMIVEDDIYGLYATQGRCTFKSMAPEQVFYLTSFSKCLTPLLRLGVLLPPAGHLASVARHLRAAVWGAVPFAVEMGCAMVEQGLDVSIGETLRAEARQRMALAARLLGLPQVPMPQGAPHLWLPMPRAEAEALARRAGERGIRLTPPGAAAIGPGGADGLRLCIMSPRERETVEHALRCIAELRAAPEETII